MLKENERLDDLQRDNLYIIQNRQKYCFTCDAVFLSDFCIVKDNESVMDFGTGSGVIAILLSAKTKAKHIYGVELQEDMCDLARRSVEYNKLIDRIEIINADIKHLYKTFRQKVDVIVCNPPYFKTGDKVVSKNKDVALAKHEKNLSLDEWCLAAKRQLNYRGRFNVIFPAQRMIELINTLCNNNLQPKRLQLVCNKNKTPHLVMIESVLGGKPELKILENLII